MIQATELRIGNWVEEVFAGGRGQKQVNWLMLQDMCKKTPMFLYEPIPLSPDILEKCGFVKEIRGKVWEFDGEETVYFLNGVDIFHKEDQGFFYATYTRYPGRGFKAGVQVEHLHHLQNLIFALTGEELTLNL